MTDKDQNLDLDPDTNENSDGGVPARGDIHFGPHMEMGRGQTRTGQNASQDNDDIPDTVREDWDGSQGVDTATGPNQTPYPHGGTGGDQSGEPDI